MPSRGKAPGSKSRRRRRSSRPALRDEVPRTQESPLAAVIHRAKLDPASLSSGDIVHLQRTIGNQRVSQLLAGTGGRAVVQRDMTVTADLPKKKLGDEAQGKLDNILKDLQEVGKKVKPTVELELKIIDKFAICPAVTIAKGNKITISLRKFFLEMASEREILGLLAHELGVHNLADMEMKHKDPTYAGKELHTMVKGKNPLTKLITSELKITPYQGKMVKTGKGDVFDPTDKRQYDHVAVAQSIVYKSSKRADRYVKTMLRMGDAIESSGRDKKEAERLIKKGLVFPGYDAVLKCSHLFNVLEARGAISVTERTGYIARVRGLARNAALAYIAQREEMGHPLLKN